MDWHTEKPLSRREGTRRGSLRSLWSDSMIAKYSQMLPTRQIAPSVWMRRAIPRLVSKAICNLWQLLDHSENSRALFIGWIEGFQCHLRQCDLDRSTKYCDGAEEGKYSFWRF